MRESLGSTKPTGGMKVKAGLALAEVGSCVDSRSRAGEARAHHRPVSSATSVRRSRSVHVGTRKMVNYA